MKNKIRYLQQNMLRQGKRMRHVLYLRGNNGLQDMFHIVLMNLKNISLGNIRILPYFDNHNNLLGNLHKLNFHHLHLVLFHMLLVLCSQQHMNCLLDMLYNLIVLLHLDMFQRYNLCNLFDQLNLDMFQRYIMCKMLMPQMMNSFLRDNLRNCFDLLSFDKFLRYN